MFDPLLNMGLHFSNLGVIGVEVGGCFGENLLRVLSDLLTPMADFVQLRVQCRDLLDKVNHAVNAIDRGTYGICENCGNPIAKARLLALPYSTLCLNCKQIDERTR